MPKAATLTKWVEKGKYDRVVDVLSKSPLKPLEHWWWVLRLTGHDDLRLHVDKLQSLLSAGLCTSILRTYVSTNPPGNEEVGGWSRVMYLNDFEFVESLMVELRVWDKKRIKVLMYIPPLPVPLVRCIGDYFIGVSAHHCGVKS